MQELKSTLRNSPVRSLYLWLANRYRGLRRLVAYPTTARVGVVDYDEYWDSKAQSGLGILSPWRLRRAQVFASIVTKDDHVLDLGVGDGALLEYIIREKGVEGYGLDVSQKAVDFCRSRGLNVTLADINEPVSKFVHDSFDYIIMSEIIEHIPDPEKLLLDLRPFARKGLIVSVPNTGFHQHRLRLLLGRFPLQWVVTPGEHLRYWTRADFHWWAKQLGFSIVREVPYEGTSMFKDIMPGLFAAAFVFVLAPPPTKS
ncbi:MAG: methyltransferase domain-containing protein [Anaerolineae bacterium]|nr:methyltransferase domain-containing protein [Anaerolineae bacterium]MCA9910228.1 methyltransferase domain-containing protein [Anaerolineae bacterium]